jgi:hypothetical protein
MVALFPTSGVIDEELQVGRIGEIELLTESMLAGENRIIAEPRRVGKSSLIGAVLKRILHHDQQRTALSIDLRDGVSNSAELAVELLNQARQQGAGGRRAAIKHLEQRTKDAARAVTPLDLGKIADDLDAPEVSAMLQGFAEALREGRASLHDVLRILDDFGRAKDRPTVIFIDEVQETGKWADGEMVVAEIAVAAKRGGRTVSFVLTGSEVSTVKALFAEGGPLIGVVRRLSLPVIDDQVWQDALIVRYGNCGLGITREQIQTILAVSDGHPLKTMLICREILDWLLPGDDHVSDVAVERAIIAAGENPAWGQL